MSSSPSRSTPPPLSPAGLPLAILTNGDSDTAPARRWNAWTPNPISPAGC